MKPHLLLLPGMLCDEAYFAAQLCELGGVATVTVASYPSIPSISAMADTVLRDAPDRFAVAGHSMGGRVALELIARVPDRITGIGLFATDYRGFSNDEERSSEESRRCNWLAKVDSRGFQSFAEDWAPFLVAPSRRGDRALLSSISAMAMRFGRPGLDAHCLAGLSRPDYAHLLPIIGVPALVMTGSEDTIRTPAVHQEMARPMPDVQVEIIDGAGHMLSMEDPSAVTAAMLRWLRRLA